MPDQITWRLTSDSSQVRSDMMTTVNTVQQGTSAMVNGLNRMDAAHGNLLKSNARVGHQIANVARQFTMGADAGSLFSVALEAVGRSLKLGLGAITGLFVGGVIIGEIAKAAGAVTKLQQEIAALVAPSPDAKFQTLDKLISKLDEVHKKTAEVKQQGFLAAVGAAASELFGGKNSSINEDGSWAEGHNKPMSERTGKLDREGLRLAKGIAEHRRRQNDAKEAGGAAGERMEAYQSFLPKYQAAFFSKNMALAAEELRSYANTIKEINAKEQEAKNKVEEEKKKRFDSKVAAKSESMKLSLAEIAAGGRQTAIGDDSHWGAGRAAREAMKEEALAKKEMLAEHYDLAGQHQQRADTIKNSIMPLKDSEKDLLNAIERARVFHQIEENTRQKFVNH